MILGRLNALLISVLVAGLAGGSLPGTVMCFGEDGHVAIEQADSGCCPEESIARSRSGASLSPEAEHEEDDCGDCVDVVIGDSAERILPDQAPTGEGGPSTTQGISAVLLALDTEHRFAASLPSIPHLDQVRRMRVSTILLI